MATKIRMRTDKLENWESKNPNLIKGEFAIVTFSRAFANAEVTRTQIVIGGDDIPWHDSYRLNTRSNTATIDGGDLAIETMNSMRHIKD